MRVVTSRYTPTHMAIIRKNFIIMSRKLLTWPLKSLIIIIVTEA